MQELSEAFKLRDLGPTSFLLGIESTRDRPNRRIILSQRHYVIDMLERNSFSSCSPVKMAMVPKVKLSSTDSPSTAEDKVFMAKVPYLSAVGSLMYMATSTRPDIAYAVWLLARFNLNPGKAHWQVVKYNVCYGLMTIKNAV